MSFSLTELNRPKDWDSLTEMDRKHIPVIEAPDSVEAGEPFEVKIR
ncbi:MAG: desulfoferrodoxin family protein [Candidatus Bathyarchaeia archaeon]